MSYMAKVPPAKDQAPNLIPGAQQISNQAPRGIVQAATPGVQTQATGISPLVDAGNAFQQQQLLNTIQQQASFYMQSQALAQSWGFAQQSINQMAQQQPALNQMATQNQQPPQLSQPNLTISKVSAPSAVQTQSTAASQAPPSSQNQSGNANSGPIPVTQPLAPTLNQPAAQNNANTKPQAPASSPNQSPVKPTTVQTPPKANPIQTSPKLVTTQTPPKPVQASVSPAGVKPSQSPAAGTTQAPKPVQTTPQRSVVESPKHLVQKPLGTSPVKESLPPRPVSHQNTSSLTIIQKTPTKSTLKLATVTPRIKNTPKKSPTTVTPPSQSPQPAQPQQPQQQQQRSPITPPINPASDRPNALIKSKDSAAPQKAPVTSQQKSSVPGNVLSPVKQTTKPAASVSKADDTNVQNSAPTPVTATATTPTPVIPTSVTSTPAAVPAPVTATPAPTPASVPSTDSSEPVKPAPALNTSPAAAIPVKENFAVATPVKDEVKQIKEPAPEVKVDKTEIVAPVATVPEVKDKTPVKEAKEQEKPKPQEPKLVPESKPIQTKEIEKPKEAKPPVQPKPERKQPEAKPSTSKADQTPKADGKSKRARKEVQPFQSPIPEIENAKKASITQTIGKDSNDKLIYFYKNEYLAVRNAEGGFYICQATANVTKKGQKIKIRWFNEPNAGSNNYIPDYYDTTDFECVLTTVDLQKASKNIYHIPETELKRIEHILKNALDVEKGILPKPDVTEENPDGLDLSLYTSESQLERSMSANAKTPKSSKKKSAKKKLSASKKSKKRKADEDETGSEEEDDDSDFKVSPKNERASATTPSRPPSKRVLAVAATTSGTKRKAPEEKELPAKKQAVGKTPTRSKGKSDDYDDPFDGIQDKSVDLAKELKQNQKPLKAGAGNGSGEATSTNNNKKPTPITTAVAKTAAKPQSPAVSSTGRPTRSSRK